MEEQQSQVARIEPAAEPVQSVSLTSVLQAQIQAVVNIQAEMAYRHPRDEAECLRSILEVCRDPELAAKAEYEFPRGRSKVVGPTVHLLRAIAQRWRNINTQIMEVGRSSDESKVMVYALDVETNYMEQMSFSVPHYRTSGEKGRVRLTDDRDIYEMVANQGARRQRKCLEDIIPRGVTQQAIAQCRKTLEETEKATPMDQRVAKAIKSFKDQFNVTEKTITDYIGKPKKEWEADDLRRLSSLFNAIRDGHVTVDAAFAPKPDTSEGATPSDEAADELEARAKQAGQAEQESSGGAAPEGSSEPGGDEAPAPTPENAGAGDPDGAPEESAGDEEEPPDDLPETPPSFPAMPEKVAEALADEKRKSLRAIDSEMRGAWAKLGQDRDAVVALIRKRQSEWGKSMSVGEANIYTPYKAAVLATLKEAGWPHEV